jgi:lichenan operon transcriptional antiterminator
MNHVIQWFKDKDIQINKSKGNTFTINAIEQNIRKVYIKYFSNMDVMNLIASTTSNGIFDKLILNTKNDLISFLKEENIKLTGDEFNVLVIDIVVVVFRSMNGYRLNSFEYKQIQKNNLVLEEIDFLNEIKTLNEFDKEYIVCMVNKLIIDYKDVKKNKQISKVVKLILSNISKTFEFSFSNDILDGLCEVLSKSFEVEATEYSLSNIKKEYPLAFEMAMAFANQINIDLNINLSESKLIDIVFLFAINMEFDMYAKENEQRDVAIVCKSNKYNTDLLEIRIKRHFPAFNIIGCYAPYRLDEVINMNPELIISTSILDTDELPVIVIDPMFKDYDVIKINSFINQIEHKESNTYDFMNLFKEDLFFKDIDANNQYEVINSLFDILKKSGRGNEQFLQAVFDRESISSTYIGNMVAIPHAIGVNIGENVVAIGITKKPINWQNDKVQLIFLINIRNASEGKVKQIFNSFFEVINSRRKVERLIKSENFYEFIKTISS